MNFFLVFGLTSIVFAHKSIFFLFLILEILFFGFLLFLLFSFNYKSFILALILIVLSAVLGMTMLILSVRNFFSDKIQNFLF